MAFDVLVVDRDDRPIRVTSNEEVWRKGLFHRVVIVLVEHKDGRILLQKRSPKMELSPDTWDSSAAGHVDRDESYEEAALRELEEEIGLKDVELEEIHHWHSYKASGNRILNRFNKLYRVRVNQTKFVLQETEVSEVKWFSLSEIRRLIEKQPERVSGGLIEDIKMYRAHHDEN